MRARRRHTYNKQPSTFYHASTRSLVYFDFSLTHDTYKRWSIAATAIPALIYLHVAYFHLCLTTISRFFYSFLPHTYITVQHEFSVFVLLALVILLILRLARVSVYVFTCSFVHSPDPTIRIGSPYSVEEKDFYHSMNTCSFGFPTARFSLHANSQACSSRSRLSLAYSSSHDFLFTKRGCGNTCSVWYHVFEKRFETLIIENILACHRSMLGT